MSNRKSGAVAVALALLIMLMPFGCERAEDELLMPTNTTNENQGLLKNGTNTKAMVEIDIKPGSDTNPINVKSEGLVAVAILSTSIADGESIDFDATTIDPTTLEFGPNDASIAHKKGHIKDVDGDGDDDLVVHFRTMDIGIESGDFELEISGETLYGSPISGVNSIVPVGCKILDGSGNEYTFVTIGTQDWLVENLKTTKYNDGTDIPLVTDNTAWGSLTENEEPGYCWYDNDQATYGDTYGALYNWHTVNPGNPCPIGWHVPSDAEWTELTDYLAANGHSGTEATALKATSGWPDGYNGTDDYGFTALPGSARNDRRDILPLWRSRRLVEFYSCR
jgi:uncharacterized protein (TIGR02145 family)